jgi:hypothetical protein
MRALRRQYVQTEPAPLPPGGGRAVGHDELLARRERLERELAELQFDLGGLAYEMAIRDHFRVDLLARRAARLQETTPSSARSSGSPASTAAARPAPVRTATRSTRAARSSARSARTR